MSGLVAYDSSSGSEDESQGQLPEPRRPTVPAGGLMAQLQAIPKKSKPAVKKPLKMTLRDKRRLLLAVPDLPEVIILHLLE